MKPLTLHTVADWSGGVLAKGAPETSIGAVSTDTRAIPGSPFCGPDGGTV